MLFGKYIFRCRLVEPAIVPIYKGSVFRGAFGHALKRVACSVRRRDCDGCLLRNNCVYARTFEPLRPNAAKSATPPHPYVLEPPLDESRELAAGAALDFSLLLFGEINEFLPFFVYALEEMGRAGVGRREGDRRGRFEVHDVLADGRSIFNREANELSATTKPAMLALDSTGPSQRGALHVGFQTPLRLKFKNRLHDQLPFHLLARAMLRRIASLFEWFGQGEPAVDYKGLVAAAQGVETARSDLHWLDVKRYSSRQDQALLMGGIKGSVVYEGDIGPFLPLLDICRRLHVGKQTAFGLGLFDFTFQEAL